MNESIAVKSRHELELMREAGRHAAEILTILSDAAKPGVATLVLNQIAIRELEQRKLKSSFIGYAPGGLSPYPAAVCVSVNEEIVHGIPSVRELAEGDILSLDFGVEYKGFHGDSAITVPIGQVTDEAKRLIGTTSDALDVGIAEMVPGKRLSDIGHAIQKTAEENGYSVVRKFVGHGIGRRMHEAPQVPNFGASGRGTRLQRGMVFAVEPMVNVGTEDIRLLEDEWTAVTADGKLSAHFEHTVAITDDGPEVLTRRCE